MDLTKIMGRKSVSYEAITIAGEAIGFTYSLILPTSGDYKNIGCREVFCTLETNDVRWTIDGTTPTSIIGHLMKVGENLTLEHPDDIANFRAIKVTDNGSLKCTYKF